MTIHFNSTSEMNTFRSGNVSVDMQSTDNSNPNWEKTYNLNSASEYSVNTYYSYVHYDLNTQAGSSAIWNSLVGYTTSNNLSIDFGTTTAGSLLTSLEVNEFSMGVSPTSLSYYDKIDDFFQFGLGTYPAIDGVKGNVTGDLIGGTDEDFVNI